MNIYQKIKQFCRPFRIIIGLVAIVIGYILSDGSLSWSWWYLGVLPLVVGITNFCPLCTLTNKCDIGSRK